MPPEIESTLASGENVLWHGRPRPYVFMLRGLPNVAYGVTWSVLGAFWYHGAIIARFDGWWAILPYLSLPFIAAGFSFFLYPIRLGQRARRTWYVVTNQRIFIAELFPAGPKFRIFSAKEMGPPQVVKRFDSLYDVILTRRAQENPHLAPRLDSGFFGLENGEVAAGAVNETTCP